MKRFQDIQGGQAAFEAAFAEAALVAAVKQGRYADYLSELGPPGAAAWDPIQGEVTLRGHTFEAQQVGSFDGESWMWSWANSYLRIPEAHTSVARSLRDTVNVAAFREPVIAAADERLPFLMGGFALAHTNAAGYYIANQSQVYAVAPFEGSDEAVSIAELRGAMRALKSTPVMPFQAARALRFAARAFGLHWEEDSERVRLRHGEDEVSADFASERLQRLAVCFLPKRMQLSDVLGMLAAHPNVPKLDLKLGSAATQRVARAVGAGWRAHVTCDDDLRTLRSEANGLPARRDEALERATVVVVEGQSEPGLREGLVPSRSAFQSAWVPATLVESPAGVVAPQALRICEALAALPDALVYDVALQTFYDD